MAFARQHYELIAQVLRVQKPVHRDTPEYFHWQKIVNHFAITLGHANAKFDSALFKTACGMD